MNEFLKLKRDAPPGRGSLRTGGGRTPILFLTALQQAVAGVLEVRTAWEAHLPRKPGWGLLTGVRMTPEQLQWQKVSP